MTAGPARTAPGPQTPQLRRWGERGALALWFTSLSVALTWPAVTSLHDAALGSPHADGLKHLWTVWRIRDQLYAGEVPFQTELVNYPYGLDLYPIEPLNGLLASFMPWLGAIAVSNVIALINLTLVGLCGAWLGQRLSGSRCGAFAAGTLLQGSAAALFTIHVGVGELQHVWWVPLGLVAWMRLRYPTDDAAVGGYRHATLLGLALAAATLSCFYHGFFLATSVAALSLMTLWAGRATFRLLARYAAAAGLGLAVILPIITSFETSYRSEDPPEVGVWAYMMEEHGQPLTDPPSARLELSHLAAPAVSRRDPSSRELAGYGGGRYIGLPALLLAALALALTPRRALPWVLTGALGVLIALGSYLAVGGEDVVLDGGRRIRLPFLFLNRALGYVAEPVNFPVRFLTITATALAACAGLVAGQGRRWAAAAVGLALISVVDVQRHQLPPRPMATLAPWDYPKLERLADADMRILDFSLAARADVEVRWASMSAQLAHQQPIHGVHIDRVQFFAQEGQRFAQALAVVEELGPALSAGRVDSNLRDLDKRYVSDLSILLDAGFTHVLVLGIGGSRTVPQALASALRQVFGAPVVDTPGALLYAIPAQRVDAARLEGWKAEHARRMEALAEAQAGRVGPQLR